MEPLLPVALGIIGTLVSSILGIVTWLQRAKAKADAALIAQLREDAERERGRTAEAVAERKVAEVRLDAFRITIASVTDVLERSIALHERVAGVLPGANRRAGDRRGP